VDLAVMGSIEHPQDLEGEAFAPNELVVIAAPDHPLTRRRQIPLEALAGETLLLREEGSGTRTDVEAMLAQRGITVSVMMELRSSGAIKQAVAAGLGVAVMPLGALELELLAGRVAVLDVAGFPVMRSWSLARRPGRRLSAAAEALWRFLLAYRGEVVSDVLEGAKPHPRPASSA